jgi:hypothetical protein
MNDNRKRSVEIAYRKMVVPYPTCWQQLEEQGVIISVCFVAFMTENAARF